MAKPMVNHLDESSDEPLDDIWIAYRETNCPELRERLILEYAHIVKYVAGRLKIYLNHNMDFDDLVSCGIFGLIDAVEKFDMSKGVKFESYASLRIRGAIIDGLRDLDWVPRSVRRKSKNDENTELQSMVSLDDFLAQNMDFAASDDGTPENHIDKIELRNILIEAIENLSERDRLVITLHYFEELTLRELSKTLEISESRVSQIHTRALSKMQENLGKYRFILYQG